MVQRVNILFDDEIWKQLQAVPSGERSRAVNEALSDWLLRRQRLRASEEMDKLRMKTKSVSSAEIVDLLRSDRKRGR